MKFSGSTLLNLAMVGALVAVALIARQWSPLLLPKADLTGTAAPGCDLRRQACAASFGEGGRLQLSITPRPIPMLQPLQVEVSVSGVAARKVEVDFAGASMNMGYNRNQLTAAPGGTYRGDTSLPVCVSGSMTWVATVMVETDRQRIAVPFRFDTGR